MPEQTFLPCLQQLDLRGNRLVHITDAARCPSLTRLCAEDNALQDTEDFLQTMRALPLLEYVEFANNPFADQVVHRLQECWPGARRRVEESGKPAGGWQLAQRPSDLCSAPWASLASTLHRYMVTSHHFQSTAGGGEAGERALAVRRLAALLSLDTVEACDASVSGVLERTQPPATVAAPPLHVERAAVKLQAFWRGTRIRPQIYRALGAASFEDEDDFLYDDIDIGEFDVGLDLLDKEYADLRPPQVIAAAQRSSEGAIGSATRPG